LRTLEEAGVLQECDKVSDAIDAILLRQSKHYQIGKKFAYPSGIKKPKILKISSLKSLFYALACIYVVLCLVFIAERFNYILINIVLCRYFQRHRRIYADITMN